VFEFSSFFPRLWIVMSSPTMTKEEGQGDKPDIAKSAPKSWPGSGEQLETLKDAR
jgi:hypothetical protein